jgi:hypothetical protein
MNGTAAHIIPPRLVHPPERLCRQLRNAVRGAGVHLVRPNARMGLQATHALYGCGHARGGVKGGFRAADQETEERIDVGNPRLVFKDRAVVVEVPKRDLV